MKAIDISIDYNSRASGLYEAAAYLLARANRARSPDRKDYDKAACEALREAGEFILRRARRAAQGDAP